MKAILRQIRIAPKKFNLVAALVRTKKVEDAVNILKFTPKKSARALRKLIESAAANAENNFKQKKSDLYIKEIIVNGGPTLKRSIPISRGRANPILKRTSNIIVKLDVLKETAKTETESDKKVSAKDETIPTKKPSAKSKSKK